MTNFWLLPFGMIGFWLAVGVIALIRTPKTSTNSRNSLSKHLAPN